MAVVTSPADWSAKTGSVLNAADAGVATLTGTYTWATDSSAPWTTPTSKKYMAGTENTAGTIKVSTWTTQIDASGKWGCVLMWLRLRTTTAASRAHQATPATNFFRLNSGSVLQYYFTRTTLRDGSTNVHPGKISGLKHVLAQSGAQLIDQTPVNTYLPNHSSTGEGTIPAFPYDRWVRVAIKVYRHATDGRLTAYMDGEIIAETTKLDIATAAERGSGSDSFTSMSVLTGGWTFNLPAIAGMAWDIGPVEDWADNGYSTGLPTELRPNWSWGAQSTDSLRRWDECTWMDRTDGGALASTLDGGITLTVAPYDTAGDHPGTNRLQIVRTGGTNAVISQQDAIGSLTYDADGYAHVCVPMVYFPANVTGSLSIRNAGNSADIAKVDFDGTDIKIGSQTILASYSKTRRYRVNFIFGQSGDLRIWVYRHDDSSADYTQRCFSVSVTDGWTPAALGIAKASFAFTSNATAEFEAFTVHAGFNVGGVDSYSQVNGTTAGGTGTLTPYISVQQHYLQFMGAWKGAELKPHSPYRLYDHPTNPQPRRVIFPVGASGHTLSQFQTEVIAGCAEVRGVTWWFPGNWTNDVNQGGTTEAQMSAVRTQAISDMRTMARYLTSRGMRTVFCSLVPWCYEGTLDGTTNKVDRSGSTCTLTIPAGHGYNTADKITFVDMSDTSLNCQSKTFTKTSASAGTFTQGSGAVTGASGKVRYWNDQQIMVCRQLNADVWRVASEEQRSNLISFLPIGAAIARADKAFGQGFTLEAHPSDTYKFLLVDEAFSTYKYTSPMTTPGAVGAGWFRGGRRKAFVL